MTRQAKLSRGLIGVAALCVLLGAAVLLYAGSGGAANERVMIVMLIDLILVLSLQIFVGNTGVLSFGHTVFPAVAAYCAALLGTPAAIRAASISELPLGLESVEVGFLPALLVGVLGAVLVGLVLGVAVARLNGLGASILSLALLVVTHQLLLNASDYTGGAQGFFGIPVETTLIATLVAACLAILVARLFKDSLAGLWAQAGREDQLAAEAMGVSVFRSRYVPWTLSAAVGGIGGGLLGFYLGQINPSEFYLDITFTIVAFLILGGMRSVTGAVVGTVVLTAILELARRLSEGPVVAGIDLPEIVGLSQLCLGVTILIVMARRPSGLLGEHEIDDLFRLRFRAADEPAADAPPAPAPAPAPASPAPGGGETVLRAHEISKDFAGISALSAFSFEVGAGEIVGVIGPNGAGKTTLLNVLSGNLPPSSGTIELEGQRADGCPTVELARRGIARTFQNQRLFERLTVYENVQIAAAVAARHRPGKSRSPEDLLADFGLSARALDKAEALAQGDRRRLEMARAAALSPRVLLLDEPTSGMNELEAEDLIDRIRDVRDRLGCGMVVVDHNVAFIMTLCSRLHVLNGGRQIAAGTAAEIQRHPEVIDAYLGIRTDLGDEADTAAEDPAPR